MTQSGTRWWRFATTILLLAICFAVGEVSFSAPPVEARPAPVRAQATAPVHEIDKRVLPDTSIDGPAFSSLSDYVPSPNTYPANTYPAAAMAWTGTDLNHSLNVTYSLDGFNNTQQRVTLDENSATRPAVLLYRNTSIGTLAPNLIVLAWTGTDQNHSLNVMFDVFGARQMITLGDNSHFPPSLAFFKGQVWLAWTGTDPQHSLNVMAMGADGLKPGHKTILSRQGAGFSSRISPSLRADMRDNLLLLTWTMLASPSVIDLAQSADGSNWSTSFSPPPPQTSGSGPDVMGIPGTVPAGLPTDYWTWTGTDPLHSLNIAYTSTLANWPAPVVTLDEQAFGGPELGYSNKLGLGAPNTVTVLLVWTGLDGSHHLNVAVIQVG
jgi:hypothetical protein